MVLPGFPWVAEELWFSPEDADEGHGPVFSDSRLERALVVDAVELNTAEGRVGNPVEYGLSGTRYPVATRHLASRANRSKTPMWNATTELCATTGWDSTCLRISKMSGTTPPSGSGLTTTNGPTWASAASRGEDRQDEGWSNASGVQARARGGPGHRRGRGGRGA